MKLKHMLVLIPNNQKCRIDFGDGIEGTALVLNTALNDILLSYEVSSIKASENVILIHLK